MQRDSMAPVTGLRMDEKTVGQSAASVPRSPFESNGTVSRSDRDVSHSTIRECAATPGSAEHAVVATVDHTRGGVFRLIQNGARRIIYPLQVVTQPAAF